MRPQLALHTRKKSPSELGGACAVWMPSIVLLWEAHLVWLTPESLASKSLSEECPNAEFPASWDPPPDQETSLTHTLNTHFCTILQKVFLSFFANDARVTNPLRLPQKFSGNHFRKNLLGRGGG